MTFDAPVYLWGLLLVPALALGYVLLQRRRSRYAMRFTNVDLLANLVPRSPRWRRHVPTALLLLALAALIVGVARPQMTTEVSREEAGVVLALDVSGSMRATDVQPTRLDSAREAAEAFLDEVPEGFQVGVVAFSGEAYVAAPLTEDRDAVRRALSGLTADGGTAIGDAILRSLETAQQAGDTIADVDPESGDPPVAVVLLSDGAPSEGTFDPIEAAERARAAGVPVHTVALGTPEGTVQLQNQLGQMETVPVPPDEETLREIAETTGASFATAPSETDARAIYEELGSQIGYAEEERDVTFAFAAGGAIVLLLSGLLSAFWFQRLP